MTHCIEFDEVIVLIPGYSPDDIPSDLEDDAAESLLNAAATSWHPALLARTRGIPRFRQAESLNHFSGRHVFLVPKPAEDWMPHEWQQEAEASTSLAIGECITRDDWQAAISRCLEQTAPDESPQPAPEPCCVDDFLAFGLCHLLIVVLSRRMHHFVDPDEATLTREIHAAAIAALAGDEETTRRHLQACFDSLRETREQIYPLDCYLVDLCVPPAGSSATDLLPVISHTPKLNVVCSARELDRWIRDMPNAADQIRSRMDVGELSLLTGCWSEQRSLLGPAVATLHDLERGQAVVRQHTGHDAACWGRKRFGLAAGLPLLLRHEHVQFALHAALDDGLYPEAEHSWFDWHSPGGIHVTSSSRIPLAVDSPAALLKLPDRLRESMQDDASAVVLFARLPDLRTPWPDDLRRAAAWSPVIGHYTTIDELCGIDSIRGRRIEFKHNEYLTPHLIQSSVLAVERPVSDPARLYQLWLKCESVAQQVSGRLVVRTAEQQSGWQRQLSGLRDRLNDLEADRNVAGVANTESEFDEACNAIESELQRMSEQVADAMLDVIPAETSTARGLFLQNALPFARHVLVDWPENWKPPVAAEEIAGFQCGKAAAAVVRLPPGGFLWLTESRDSSRAVAAFQPARREPPLAEPLALRNRHFEVTLSEQSGGIESIRFHGTREVLLSQRPCFRFDRSQPLTGPDGDDAGSTFYADPVQTKSRVVRSETLRGAVETEFELRSPQDAAVLCRGRQIVALDRFQPRLHVTLCFDEILRFPRGNPWLTYYGSRFAWSRADSVLSRGVMHQAAFGPGERFESPDYLELANDDYRLIIAVHGRPYHRRSGDSMLDSLLIVEGEPATSFQYTIDVNQALPMTTVLESLTPPVIRTTAGRVPQRSASAWILGITARNVVIMRSEVDTTIDDSSVSAPRRVVRLMLLETEGRDVDCGIRTARMPVAAQLCAGIEDARPLDVAETGVTIRIPAFQLREVELHF